MRTQEITLHKGDKVKLYLDGELVAEGVPVSVLVAAPAMLKQLKSIANYLDGLKGPFNHELLGIRETIYNAMHDRTL